MAGSLIPGGAGLTAPFAKLPFKLPFIGGVAHGAAQRFAFIALVFAAACVILAAAAMVVFNVI
jgi:hypothetical protein